MLRSSTVLSAIVAATLVGQASAAGYNESNPAYYGVAETGGVYQSVTYTYGPLNLTGIIFGPAETGGPVSFDTWAKTVTCPTIASQGYTCVDWAIQNATLAAASGVQGTTPTNIFNTVLLHRQTSGTSGGWSGQYGVELGQGPSCPSLVADTPWSVAEQNAGSGNCTASPYAIHNNGAVPSMNVLLPTRGIKVTCKSACANSTIAISTTNWGSLLTQLTSDLSSNNYYAARFAVTRKSGTSQPNPVIARCRLTIPYINGYGMDECPDYIYGSDSLITDEDITFNPEVTSFKRHKRTQTEFNA